MFSSIFCPFLIIITGSPIFPFLLLSDESSPPILVPDHAFRSAKSGDVVDPNLIELPNLPSNIWSPSYGNIVCIRERYLNYSPNLGLSSSSSFVGSVKPLNTIPFSVN